MPNDPENMRDMAHGAQPVPAFGASHAAGEKAAAKSGTWRMRILSRLAERPSCLWEVASFYGVPDHIISGRFTELAADGYIEPTGQTRTKPATQCQANIYQIRRASSDQGAQAGLDEPGQEVEQFLDRVYPNTVKIEGELFDRQTLLPGESYPAMPYARRADTGGMRQLVRIELIECPGCGKPLFFRDDSTGKKFVCGNERCARVWRCRCVQEPGKAAALALVMETIS